MSLPKRKELPTLGELTVDVRTKKEEDISAIGQMSDECAELRLKMIEDGSRDEMKLRQPPHTPCFQAWQRRG